VRLTLVSADYAVALCPHRPFVKKTTLHCTDDQQRDRYLQHRQDWSTGHYPVLPNTVPFYLLFCRFEFGFQRLHVLDHEAHSLASSVAHEAIEAQSTNTADMNEACLNSHDHFAPHTIEQPNYDARMHDTAGRSSSPHTCEVFIKVFDKPLLSSTSSSASLGSFPTTFTHT
jgi:hypothetical protein